MPDPADTPLGQRLNRRKGEAEALWREMLAIAESRDVLTVLNIEEFMEPLARALTWRLWEMAIQEAERLPR
jgi:hypothetical protein